MAKSLLDVTGSASQGDNTSRYINAWGAINLALASGNSGIPVRQAATVGEFRSCIATNTTAVTSTIIVRKNATDQTPTVTYTSGQTGEKQDTSNSFSVADTDLIDIASTVPNDASGSKLILHRGFSLMLDTDDDTQTDSLFGVAGVGVGFSAANTTSYVYAGNPADNATTERTVRILRDYTSQRLAAHFSANLNSGAVTIRSRVNSANGSQSITFSAGETGLKEDTSHTDSLTNGDEFALSLTTAVGGSGAITAYLLSCWMTSSDGRWEAVAGSKTGRTVTSATVYYSGIMGRMLLQTPESNVSDRIGFGADLTDFRCYVSANSATTDSVANVRVEAADSALSVTYTTGQTGLKTDTDLVAVATDDLITYSYTLGTSGSITYDYLAVTGWDRGLTAIGIASTAAVGTPELLDSSRLLATGIASTSALGTPNLDASLYASGIASTTALGTASISANVSLYATGIASTSAVGTPNLDAALSASGVASTEAHGSASVDVALTASGVASTLAIGTPSFDASVYAQGIASTAAAGTPALTGSLTASGIASTAALGTPSLTSALTASGIASTSALGTPNLDASLYASGIASTSAAGTPGLSVALGASGIASGAALGTPWLTGALSVAGIASTATIPTPALAVTLGASGVASTTTVPTPGLAASLGASGIASGAAVGTPGIWSAATVTGIASTEAWGTPTLSVQLYAEGIASTLVIGSHRRSLVDAAGTATLDRSLSGGVTLVRAVEDDVTIDRSLVGGVTITDSAAGAVTLARSLTGTVSGG